MPTTVPDNILGEAYRGYHLDNQYTLVEGKYVLPLAVDQDDLDANDSPVLIVTAHAPYRIRNTAFAAKKQGNPPQLPSPESAGKCIFLGGDIHFSTPSRDANCRTYTWEAAGGYTYVEDIKHSIDDGFVLGDGPIASNLTEELYETYSAIQLPVPISGAVAYAGIDAKLGWKEALASVNFSSPIPYVYYNPSYFPGLFFNSNMINGFDFPTYVAPLPFNITYYMDQQSAPTEINQGINN